MSEIVRTGTPRFQPQLWTGTPGPSTGFLAKLKLPGSRFVIPGWENESFDTRTAVVGQLVYIPILNSETTTYLGIYIRPVGAPVAGLCRLGIYAFADGLPGALILDAGTVSTSPSGVKEIVLSQQLAPGYYFMAYVLDATPDLRCCKRLDPYSYPLSTFSNSQSFTHGRVCLAVSGQVAQVAGGLADPATTPDSGEDAESVCVAMRES